MLVAVRNEKEEREMGSLVMELWSWRCTQVLPAISLDFEASLGSSGAHAGTKAEARLVLGLGLDTVPDLSISRESKAAEGQHAGLW